MSYFVWKLLHIAAVILFLGNITTGLFWAAHANKTRDFAVIALTFDGIIRSDRWFTIPGVIGIIVAGVAAAVTANLPILGTGWIVWSIVLFSISGIVFGIWVAPLQRELLKLAQTAKSSGLTWETYESTYGKWGLWGLVALLAPVLALILMVLKPALPGL